MSLQRRDIFRLGLGGMAALGAGSCRAIPASGPTGDTLLLAIDDHWLPFRHCLCYYTTVFSTWPTRLSSITAAAASARAAARQAGACPLEEQE